jgi:hypothetical protein
MPGDEAVIVTGVIVASTPEIFIVVLVCPSGITTEDGIEIRSGAGFDNVTARPPVGAAADRTISAVLLVPGVIIKEVGENEILNCWTFTVVCALVNPVALAVTVALPTATPLICIDADFVPSSMVTIDGTVTDAVLLLEILTVSPPEGALFGIDRVRVAPRPTATGSDAGENVN